MIHRGSGEERPGLKGGKLGPEDRRVEEEEAAGNDRCKKSREGPGALPPVPSR